MSETVFMKKTAFNKTGLYLLIITTLPLLFYGCFKDIPKKTIVYEQHFENATNIGIDVYNAQGLVDTPTLTTFNGQHVFGRFNNNFLYLKVKKLPAHSILKISFDLYIHDNWDGDYIAPGISLPDAWVMNLDNYPLYLTTFSNGTYRQSFPDNYTAGGFKNIAKANAWATDLPGACSSQSAPNKTTLYKIERLTSHTGDSLVITMNDVLQPPGNYCLKSWSIDNLVITTNQYQ